MSGDRGRGRKRERERGGRREGKDKEYDEGRKSVACSFITTDTIVTVYGIAVCLFMDPWLLQG